jgi:DNA-directed RNA polymerase subunit RPC12/RpoP
MSQPPNYCPYCGRFMMMKAFEHACDRVNVMRGTKEWCSRCGAKLSVSTDDLEKALCRVCMSRIEEWPKEEK